MKYIEWKLCRKDDWTTEPISCMCQVLLQSKPLRFCDKPTVKAYPAMGGGWATLCSRHALKHKEAFDVCELIEDGEVWG